jgi:hypothetical protein
VETSCKCSANIQDHGINAITVHIRVCPLHRNATGMESGRPESRLRVEVDLLVKARDEKFNPSSTGDSFGVGLIFEREGCRLYRFPGEKSYIYYVDKGGRTPMRETEEVELRRWNENYHDHNKKEDTCP